MYFPLQQLIRILTGAPPFPGLRAGFLSVLSQLEQILI